MWHITNTGRKINMPNGDVEPIYEIWNDLGIFAGVTCEALESELTDEQYAALDKEL